MGFEPTLPFWGARISGAARPTVSGYLPYPVDPPGVEPRSPARQAGVVPLDHGPKAVDRRGIEPRFPACDTGVVPLDQQPSQAVIPDGLEPSLPGCGPGVFAAGPRDHSGSSRGGSRTHKVTSLSNWPLCRFAYSAICGGTFPTCRHIRQLRVLESNLAGDGYEPPPSAGSTAKVAGPGNDPGEPTL